MGKRGSGEHAVMPCSSAHRDELPAEQDPVLAGEREGDDDAEQQARHPDTVATGSTETRPYPVSPARSTRRSGTTISTTDSRLASVTSTAGTRG